MIFLSHNYNDKPVVEQIATRLRSIYGQDKVFYDSWSIQPGDGIIDKMDYGLSECRFFFFFISTNSLASNMVKMEWQNALFKAAQNAIKFIPIRMDRSEIPILLAQSLYIDLYSNGLDVAIRQIVDVINGDNIYRPSYTFSNLMAIKRKEGGKIVIECQAKYYLEPISKFCFCTFTNLETLRYKVRDESMVCYNPSGKISLADGRTVNVLITEVQHGTTPDMPYIIEFESKNGLPFDIDAVLHMKNHKDYDEMPMAIG